MVTNLLPSNLSKNVRPISWLKAARKDFDDFPDGAKEDFFDALLAVAEGEMPQMAKPLKGFGSGVLELALRFRGDAYRVVFALQIAAEIWVVHAFQKKSTIGIKTPKHEIELIHQRLKLLFARVAGKADRIRPAMLKPPQGTPRSFQIAGFTWSF